MLGMQSVWTRVSVVVALLMMLTLPVLGQERVGELAGTVTDQSKAVVPDVTVTVTNSTTKRVFTTMTKGDGGFTAPDLEPGRYTVLFEKTGFAKFSMENVLVLVGRTVRLDASLQVGTMEQIVVIAESAVLIDASSTAIAHNVTNEEFDRIPKGRSFQALALVSPSVNTGAIEGGFQVNGASAAENNYVVDGVSTTSLIDGRARQNTVFEYLQEVQVKTGGLEAEYGGALGGVISAITKSGGNVFHGEAHYYYSGNRVSAGPTKRLTLDPVTEASVSYLQDKKSVSDNHELGGSLGGPLMKNKAWFFTSISPRWNRASYDYLFSNGTEADTLKRERLAMSWFNKLSFDPTDHIRTNFTWLYTPTRSTGGLPSYNGSVPNSSTSTKAAMQPNKGRGFSQPEQSYTGSVDVILTNSSLLSLKAGRYYLNYKDVGLPNTVPVQYQTSAIGLPFTIPADLQLASGAVNTPRVQRNLFDITTRTYGQADFSQLFSFLGHHNVKLGGGLQRNINRVNTSYGDGGYVFVYWNTAFRDNPLGSSYGYYSVNDAGTIGSTGGSIYNVYIQDQWHIIPRLTLSLGLRMEYEIMPSFRRDIKDYAFKFPFSQKRAPRLGASYDVLGNGKLKAYGSWGRYFDWTKYDLARGTFGADVWRIFYRSLDTLDVWNLSLKNMPGKNLWAGGAYRDYRLPGFKYLDPKLKPMSADMINAGVEYEIRPQMVFAARYVRNKLNRTIEDFAIVDAEGNEQYRYGNPGEGANTFSPSTGLTCTEESAGVCGFPMPKAIRKYDAMELVLTRRFTSGWFASASYVYSRLYGNYSGLQNTDEIRPATLGYGFGAGQQSGADGFRGGGNANRAWDLDEAMWDSHGNLGLLGRLPTDRPHVFKLYGSKLFKWGLEVGGFFHVSSGTPVTTQVVTISPIPVLVNGRGDLGRTPVSSQTDLMVAHEVKLSESKKLRFEFNMENLFNQKTSQFIFDRYNREEKSDSSGIDLYSTDLSKGFDYKAMVLATPDGAKALDLRYKKDAIFNPGFAGRFLVKFIF